MWCNNEEFYQEWLAAAGISPFDTNRLIRLMSHWVNNVIMCWWINWRTSKLRSQRKILWEASVFFQELQRTAHTIWRRDPGSHQYGTIAQESWKPQKFAEIRCLCSVCTRSWQDENYLSFTVVSKEMYVLVASDCGNSANVEENKSMIDWHQTRGAPKLWEI